MSVAVRNIAKIKSLSFILEEETYGIDVLKVGEINGMTDIAPLPETRLFVDGTFNLKERNLPVADLRLEFQTAGRPRNVSISVIVVRIHTSKEPVEIGVVIDKVNEVSYVGPKDIEPPPGMGPSIEKSCVAGKENGKADVHIMLDIGRIMSGEKPPAIHKEETATNNWRTEHE